MTSDTAGVIKREIQKQLKSEPANLLHKNYILVKHAIHGYNAWLLWEQDSFLLKRPEQTLFPRHMLWAVWTMSAHKGNWRRAQEQFRKTTHKLLGLVKKKPVLPMHMNFKWVEINFFVCAC